MEQRACADSAALLDQGNAALADNLFEILDSLEIGVDQRLIDKLPEVLGWLQLRAVSRLENQPDAIGHSQVFWAMPARAVELQYDALVLACARRFSEVRKDGLEQFFANRVRDVPHRGSAGRFDEAPDIEPLIAVMAKSDGPLAFGRPYPARDWLQADISAQVAPCGSAPLRRLVHGPELDRGIWMISLFFSGGVLQFFLIGPALPRPRFRDDAVLVFGSNIRQR